MRPAALLLAGLACISAPVSAESPIIIAHRGLAEGLPENTLAAFRQSIQRGVPVIEIDLRLTRDGHLVILHDETLDRTTDCSGRAADRTLQQIKACDAGWPSHSGERVPTLAEAIELVRGRPVRLLADVKPGTPLDPVLQAIRDHGAEARLILGLRRAKDVGIARAALPGLTIIAFMPEADDAPAFTSAGAHIIRLWSDWVEADPALVARTRALGAHAWIMVGRKLPRKDRDWRALHARMIAAGPQGLITDRPDLISAP
jgi:glycerophosphoryl diester phosphodiesterase